MHGRTWLAIQPVLAQVNELLMDAWYGHTVVCCFSSTVHKHQGVSDVHQRLTASAWIIKLNEVLNPHGLAADLYEKSTWHIHEHTHHNGDGRFYTSYSATMDIDLHLRLFFVECTRRPGGTPANAGGHAAGRRGRVLDHHGGTRRAAVPDVGAARADAGPILRVSCAGECCNGAADPDDAGDGTIGRRAWADDRHVGTRREAVHHDRAGWAEAGPDFQFKLPPDAAWWRTVEPHLTQAAPARQVMVRPVFALYSQPSLAHWSVGYA